MKHTRRNRGSAAATAAAATTKKADSATKIMDDSMGKRRKVSVEVYASDTIEDIKAKICEEQGFRYDHKQKLIFDGMQMCDGQTLADYNVKKGDLLHLILKEGGENT